VSPDKRYRVGIDVGGTFTDFMVFDQISGELTSLKSPSTPSAPHLAVINGLNQLQSEYSIAPGQIRQLIHGTTLAVNTMLQRNGAKVALLVSDGFRDILQLGRVRLPDVYNFLVERPAPITPRRFVREIAGRRLVDGTIDTPLDEEAVRRSARDLIEMGAEAVAVCFIHSYKYPDDEVRAVEIIQNEHPGVHVFGSSQIWPEIREYERAMVALINAHVAPIMARYYDGLLADLAVIGVNGDVYSTKSNGGMMTSTTAAGRPVDTLLSGPASGVVGARFVASHAGFDRVVAIDMGGTSTEAAVVDNDVKTSTSSVVGDFEVVLPSVDVRSLGAGGGSIAWLDRAGVLKVGPASAGADPGPAAYGLGGEKPTITDAYLVLGVLNPDNFLGGGMPLDVERARVAIATIAKPLDLDIEAAAESILRVATSNMYSKLMPLVAETGLDPRTTAIVAYGGAGPTHAFMLADEVGIEAVIVPPHPGTLCAMGCIVADVKSDFIRSVGLRLRRTGDSDGDTIVNGLQTLGMEAKEWLVGEQAETTSYQMTFAGDIRYVGQAFTVDVNLDSLPTNPESAVKELINRFDQRYFELYSVTNAEAQVDVVNLRATITAETAKPTLAEATTRGSSVARAHGRRRVHIAGGARDIPVYKRESFTGAEIFEGPAVIEQYDTTTFVPLGFTVTVDDHLNLIGRRSR
jgi:N-methylhydantoinase A